MRIRRTGAGLVGGLAVLAWAAAAAGTALAADGSVRIADFAFAPPSVAVVAGDSVTWTNEDDVAHTATGPAFDTETLGPGETATITFVSAGTYAYACAIHPAMTGTVVVAAATGAEPSDDGPAMTPAPTDALDDGATASGDRWRVAALVFAVVSLAMLGTSVALDRRRPD